MTWQSISFRKRMLVIMTLSGLIELLILVAAGFAYLKYTQEQEMGQKALGVAQFLANSTTVVELVENRDNVTYQAKFRELTEALGAAFIVVGDREGIRLIPPLMNVLVCRCVVVITPEHWKKAKRTSRQQEVHWAIRCVAKRLCLTRRVRSSAWSLWVICLIDYKTE